MELMTLIAMAAVLVSLCLGQITTIAALEAEIASSDDIIIGHAVDGGATVEWHKMASHQIGLFSDYGPEIDSQYNPANDAAVPKPTGDWLEHLVVNTA